MAFRSASIDFETQSAADLGKIGAHLYAEDQTTRPLCLAYCLPDDPINREPRLWRLGRDGISAIEPLFDHILGGGQVTAWNAAFELAIWNLCARRIKAGGFDWPELPLNQTHCSMSFALAMALPGKLEKAAPALGLKIEKDMTGNRVMLKLSQPMVVRVKGEKAETRATPPKFYDPTDEAPEVREMFEALYAYCKQDVRVERAILERVLPLSDFERRVWILDQKINNRGFAIDRPLAELCSEIVAVGKNKLSREMAELTNNEVDGVDSIAQLTKFCQDFGAPISGVSKDQIALAEQNRSDWEGQGIPPVVFQALELRKLGGKTSTAKLLPMLHSIDAYNRARGCFQFSAATTRRWGGRRIQAQNLPRPSRSHDELLEIFSFLERERSKPFWKERVARDIYPALELAFGSPLLAVSDCLRGLLRASPGNVLMALDASQIEARVIAWLAGEEKVLEIFRTTGLIYESAASDVFHVPIERVTKDQRQIGKVACIAQGEKVLTKRGQVPIEDVRLDDLVWDGVDWVSHSGAVFMGVKECIEYDGLIATADHEVFTADGRHVPFGLAASEQIPLEKTGASGRPIRTSKSHFRKSPMETPWGRPQRPQTDRFTGPMPVSDLPLDQVDKSSESNAREIERLPEMQSDFAPALLLGISPNGRREKAMHKRWRSKLPALRRPWDRVSFFIGQIGDHVRAKFAGLSSRSDSQARDRPNRQLGPLRAWQPSFCHSKRKRREPGGESIRGLFERIAGSAQRCAARFSPLIPGSPLRRSHAFQAIPGHTRSRHSPPMEQTVGKTKRPVWDILNAGPRNRFTVSDCLVHNCLALGFGGGVGAFQSMARIYGVKVSDQEADEIKKRWRDSNRMIVKFWQDLEESASRAILSPGQVFTAGAKGRECRFKKAGSFLFVMLPSRGVICYPYPSVKATQTPWGDMKDLPHFKTQDINGKWVETSTYGGSLAENVTQSLARDLLASAMLRLEDVGFPIVMHSHDEAVTEIRDPGSKEERDEVLEKASRIFSAVPAWANDLPFSAEGWIDERYRK